MRTDVSSSVFETEKGKQKSKSGASKKKGNEIVFFFLNWVWNATTLYANREIYMYVYVYIYRNCEIINNLQSTHT